MNEKTCAELINLLIKETSEDAVFTFIAAISVYGIRDIEDAIYAMEHDSDTRKWAEFTLNIIP